MKQASKVAINFWSSKRWQYNSLYFHSFKKIVDGDEMVRQPNYTHEIQHTQITTGKIVPKNVSEQALLDTITKMIAQAKLQELNSLLKRLCKMKEQNRLVMMDPGHCVLINNLHQNLNAVCLNQKTSDQIKLLQHLYELYKLKTTPIHSLSPEAVPLADRLIEKILSDLSVKVSQQETTKDILTLTQNLLNYQNLPCSSSNFRNLQKLHRVIKKQLNFMQTVSILQFYLYQGCESNYEGAKIFEDKLLSSLSHKNLSLDAYQISCGIKIGVYFQLRHFLDQFLQTKTVNTLLSANSVASLDIKKNHLQRVLLSLSLLPVFGYRGASLDLTAYNDRFYRNNQRVVRKTKTEDIAKYLDDMKIAYSREFLHPPYTLDFFLPHFPNSWDAVNLSQEKVAAQLEFESYAQLKTFYDQSLTGDSLFIEIYGRKHYFDSEQKYLDGGNKLKQLFCKQARLRLCILKQKDLEKWDAIEANDEKRRALFDLIHSNVVEW